MSGCVLCGCVVCGWVRVVGVGVSVGGCGCVVCCVFCVWAWCVFGGSLVNHMCISIL